MMNDPMVRAALAVSLLTLACTSGDVVQDDTTTSGTPPEAGSESGPPEPDPDPGPPELSEEDGAACQVDADCPAAAFCELRICVSGCVDASGCDAGQTCDPHGRCQAEDDAAPPRPIAGSAVLGERQTVLPAAGTEARTALKNGGDASLDYRLAAAHTALMFDKAVRSLAPGGEAELAVQVDLHALGPDDRVLPVQVITSSGSLLWTIEIPAEPEAGHFGGAVSFTAGDVSLGSSELVLDLDFRADGTVVGRVDNDASLLWPQPLALTGTWAEDGGVTIELRDRLPAESWRQSPLSRELGRVLVLTGTRTADGIEGTATETITGLRAALVELAGAFALRRQGPITGIVHAPDFIPADASPPGWLAPPGLDQDACEGLGTAYGTAAKLPDPEPACDACKDGVCASDDMMSCGVALRAAAYNVQDVLAPLQGGDVSPPAGAWTWDDCTADAPVYDMDGRTCLDLAALRCAHALERRGSADYPGPWGEALRAAAAIFAADEAFAAGLLGTEAEVDAALAFRDEVGEPAPDALGREVQILDASREALAAALAPLLAPTYPGGLGWIDEHDNDMSTARARVAALPLTADFARATVLWSRLAHRAGQHPDDVRAAVRLAAIAVHAAGAELHARMQDEADEDASAVAELHALGPVLESLRAAHGELSPEAGAFGYPAAYVPIALGPEDIAKSRTNFDAVHALATDEVAQFQQVAADAWQAARDYEEKTHALEATATQIETDYDQKLRALCGSLPGETEPALAQCGQHGGQVADLAAAVEAAGLRIRHAGQAAENNVHTVAVEEERFAREVEIQLGLSAEIEAAQGQIFYVKNEYGEERSALAQAEAMAECGRIQENAQAEAESITAGCRAEYAQKMTGGPTIFFVPTPDIAGLVLAVKQCDAKQRSLTVSSDNQCSSVLGQAGLQAAQEELQRSEDQEIMAINAEIDQAIRDSQLESQRAASVALIKNLRAEGLLLAIETEEAKLARQAAITALQSAYQEAAALAQEKARVIGVMIEDSPDNALTRPHFLAARLAAAARVLPVRERAIRRVYLALRALEYEVGQDLPALRDELANARAPEDLAGLLACLAGIAEDYRLEHGYGQPYVTEVSLRADIFGITADVPDVDGSPATPAEQFAALLVDPLHALPGGGVALPFSLSAYENPQFSTLLCDDRLDKIEVKLVGDYLGDREAEVMLTRQGLAGVRRCDGAELPQWSAYVPYGFDRQQVVIQAGVQDWGTAGPNAGFAAWPVHGEQWTLTIPPPEQSPANADLDLAHVSDVVLRLHHRAGTIAPAGQGTFTASCG
ncbi:MAG: hypothetical protein JNL82_11395 [Myxococcales bacterium]|nr:hypothetical protein [Myxococcales bacterium]